LTFKDSNFVKLAEKASNGMLEIQVIDTGIGIKKEDLGKLFKLFGFLNSSQELNTKGIGLGLHISKMICQQFDGDIIVNSEFNKGSNFTFILALDELKSFESNKICRILNKIKKKYAKIILPQEEKKHEGIVNE